MSFDFVEHLLALPYAFFQQRTTGDLMMRMSSQAAIRELLTTGALSALLDGAWCSCTSCCCSARRRMLALVRARPRACCRSPSAVRRASAAPS